MPASHPRVLHSHSQGSVGRKRLRTQGRTPARKGCRISSFCHDHDLALVAANPLGLLHPAFDCPYRVLYDPRLPAWWHLFTQFTARGFWTQSVRLPGFCCWLFVGFEVVIEPHFFQWVFKYMLIICKDQVSGKKIFENDCTVVNPTLPKLTWSQGPIFTKGFLLSCSIFWETYSTKGFTELKTSSIFSSTSILILLIEERQLPNRRLFPID